MHHALEHDSVQCGNLAEEKYVIPKHPQTAADTSQIVLPQTETGTERSSRPSKEIIVLGSAIALPT